MIIPFLQIANKFIDLATHIHEGRNIFRNKQIHGSLYESLEPHSLKLKTLTSSEEILLISSPIWILLL